MSAYIPMPEPEILAAELDRTREQVERLKAEIKEARNEAATVRRAYLHERWRADEGIAALRKIGTYEALDVADQLEAKAYKGPAEQDINHPKDPT